MQRYTGNSHMRAPERFIQCYVADKLMDRSFIVLVETPKGHFDEWHKITLDRRQQVDLLIYDPVADGNANNAHLRAIVELKLQIWREAPRYDVERTARTLAKLKGTHHGVLGFCIACLSDFGDHPDYPAQHIEEGTRLAAELGCATSTHVFNHVLADGTHHYGTVIGLTVSPAIEKLVA